MWNNDELILALALYFKLDWPRNQNICQEVKELNHFFLSQPTLSPNGRSVGSIKMKLNNFISLDDTHSSDGLAKGGLLDKEIWDLYSRTKKS